MIIHSIMLSRGPMNLSDALVGLAVVRPTLRNMSNPAGHGALRALTRATLMPGNRRLSCAVVFLHDGDEYKIDSAIVSNETNLGLLRCGALRLTQIVWPAVKPFDDLCPSGVP